MDTSLSWNFLCAAYFEYTGRNGSTWVPFREVAIAFGTGEVQGEFVSEDAAPLVVC